MDVEINITDGILIGDEYLDKVIENADTRMSIARIIKGGKGDKGMGIKTLVKASTEGLIDNYVITYDDNSTTTFQITNGADGKSAYKGAIAGGFVGTEAEWLASLKGADGKSAYEQALISGFVGSEAEWLASLKGETGVTTESDPVYTKWLNDYLKSTTIASNGSVVLGNLVIQWGKNSAALNSNTRVTFQRGMSEVFSIVLTAIDGNVNTNKSITVCDIDLTGFKISNTEGAAYYCYWIAIGKL